MILNTEQTPADVLAPHGKLLVRTFLDKFDDRSPEANALFDLLYEGKDAVFELETAVRVQQELELTNKRVRDVVKGWKPKALR